MADRSAAARRQLTQAETPLSRRVVVAKASRRNALTDSSHTPNTVSSHHDTAGSMNWEWYHLGREHTQAGLVHLAHALR